MRPAREEGRGPCCDVAYSSAAGERWRTWRGPRASGEEGSWRGLSATQGAGTSEQRYPPCWAYWRGA
ncbi:hypothetical protein NDU88_003707 [Pleurodeles waltl]|uniref:Uncharacterized protein n=1 Tax=Pleurodeles waltl TaxID=8319 RepID=A0AAV7T6Z9_PLEWA|nr:hypothetical protein NDU88_003707 [Pleurodeles waltl]